MRVDPNQAGMMTSAPTVMANNGMGQAMPAPQMGQPVTMANQMVSAPTTMANNSGGGSTGNWFGDFMGGFGEWISKNAGGLAGIGSIAGALDNASDVRDMGYAVQQHLENMGGKLNDGSQFQGYGVTTGLGQSGVGTDGSISFGVGPNYTHQAAGDANMVGANNAFKAALGANGGQSNMDWNPYAQQAAQQSMADPSQRQQQIFQQLMDIQNPMLDQQQAQQQAREHAMGRGGIAGSAYGGTAEDAAMAKARAMASNQAAINAMQQADSERQMFGNMAGTYGQLGNQANANAIQQGGMFGQIGNAMANLGLDQQKLSYLPMQQQLEILKAAQGTGAMAQQGQLTGQDYLAQMLLGGTNANVNAQKVSSELMGNLYNSLLSNMGGRTSSDGTSQSGWGGLFGNLSKLFEWGS